MSDVHSIIRRAAPIFPSCPSSAGPPCRSRLRTRRAAPPAKYSFPAGAIALPGHDVDTSEPGLSRCRLEGGADSGAVIRARQRSELSQGRDHRALEVPRPRRRRTGLTDRPAHSLDIEWENTLLDFYRHPCAQTTTPADRLGASERIPCFGASRPSRSRPEPSAVRKSGFGITRFEFSGSKGPKGL